MNFSRQQLVETMAEGVFNSAIPKHGIRWNQEKVKYREAFLADAEAALDALLATLPSCPDDTLEGIGNMRGYYKQLLALKRE